MSLEHYHTSASGWREQLRKNRLKTRMVIAIFIIIYLIVGFIADVSMVHFTYPQFSLEQSILLLIHGQIIPYASLLMSAFALCSILFTFCLYDRIMLLGTEYREISPTTAHNLQEQQLYNVVEEMTMAASLQYVPKVYIIEADYMNAFASGFSEKSAMVAITRGLMGKLNRAELQAVMAHELSHIRHGDIKLSLSVAVLSNIILLVVDFLFYSFLFRRNDRRDDNRLFAIILILRYTLPLLTVLLSLFLSRTREYMADAGCVELMRENEPLAQALLKINQDHQVNAEAYANEYGNTAHEEIRRASYLFDPAELDPIKSLNNIFDSHPTIAQRLQALGFTRK